MSATGPVTVTRYRPCREGCTVPRAHPPVFCEAFATLEQASPAARMALRWLDANRERYRSGEYALQRYYSGNGHLTGHASAGRRGAAGRMLARLEDRGWVDSAGYVTTLGHVALVALADSGGSLTLRKGDVIEVEVTTYPLLAERAGVIFADRRRLADAQTRALAAWNAEHGIGVQEATER